MKKFVKYISILLLLTIISSSIIYNKRIALCYGIIEKYMSIKKDMSENSSISSTDIISSIDYHDVIYKNTHNIPLTLDIYGPSKSIYKSSPVLLYVHGGSWIYGDKTIPNTLSPVLDTFRELGYTIISISYELMRDTENFNKQVCDVKDAIRWIYANADTYNLNPKEIGVIGMSSGAHLSLIASYSNNNEFIDDTSLAEYPSKVKYIIDCFGPTDLSILDTSNLNFDLTNIFKSIKNKDTIVKKFNPINYVDNDIPSTLIIHSQSDNLVPYESAEILYNKCIEEHANVKFIPLALSSHDLSEISSDDIVSISKGLLQFIIFNSPLR